MGPSTKENESDNEIHHKGQHLPTKNNSGKISHKKGTLVKTGKCGLLM